MLYRAGDAITEGIVYGAIVFSPWAFGTTQPWSIWTMTIAGLVLGALLILKLGIRNLKGYRPPRWGEAGGGSETAEIKAGQRVPPVSGQAATGEATELMTTGRRNTERAAVRALAILTVLILTYCFISGLNARSTYHRDQLSFESHSYVPWLPSSFDSHRTWFLFWTYLGLACSFWAVRDWLPGKSAGEERAGRIKPGAGAGGVESAPPLPTRLRRVLWVLSINGGLLALEGIVQRWDGSGRLLFLIKPGVNPGALTQFGPYAYRANAAQYFNLLWPVCLGFWWMLNRNVGAPARSTARRRRMQRHHWLLVSTAFMAACPIISTSRGGALITVVMLVLAGLLMLWSHFFWKNQRASSRERGAERLRTTDQGPGTTAQTSEVRGQRSKARGQRPLLPSPKLQTPASIFHLRSSMSHLALVAVCFAAALGLGYGLGWKALKPRMAEIREGFEGREEIYTTARPMAADYPLFGTGPGTFESVFQLYRASADTYWPAQLHNDWLETRITFGWVGSALIALSLLTVILRWFAPGGIRGGRRFVLLLWLALAGCLVHARYDFPFQIHSIDFLFLIHCAVLSILSRRE